MTGARKNQESTQSLANLTQDAIKLVAACCSSHDLAMLSRASKNYYMTFQPILWKHPKLSSVPALMNFTNYVQRPHLDFKNVSNEDTYMQACKARVELVETVHIRILANSADMDGASDSVKKLTKVCPEARMSLVLLKNTTTSYESLTEMFPGVLFFMFTSTEDRKTNIMEGLLAHKLSRLPFSLEQIAKESLRQVFCRDLADNPHLISKNLAAKGDILSIDIQVAVERNMKFKPGSAWLDSPLRPIKHIFWRQSNDMDKRLDQLNRLPGPWIRECMGAWTAEELEDEIPKQTFW